MTRYTSSAHHFIEACAWDPARPAEAVRDHILLSRGVSSSYLVTTDDGDVVINTGTRYEGDRHRERFEQLLGRPLRVRFIVFTQDHPDHVGGWESFADPDVETIAQRNYPEARADRERLKRFFRPRFRRFMGAFPVPDVPPELLARTPQEPEVTTLFADDHAFELGGRRFELYSVPAGETPDNLVVWLPRERTLFSGNHGGALYGALPHLMTPRGDRTRSARRFVRDVDFMCSLEPELLLTGHDDPIEGAERIRADLTRIRDAVASIHDQTVAGMNAGKDLPTLMQEIALPPELEPAPGRGPVWWYVRTVWEEYSGWFRLESTADLYPVPQRAVWAELAELAGGPDALAARAQAHAAAGRPVEAIHLVDIARSVAPDHPGALRAEIVALEQLIDRTGGRTYDELVWLEGELARAQAALDGAPVEQR